MRKAGSARCSDARRGRASKHDIVAIGELGGGEIERLIERARDPAGKTSRETLLAFREAEAWGGPSLILAYSHCIAHGIDMTTAVDENRRAVACGHWPLVRYNPELAEEGKNPLQLDSKEPTISLEEYAYGENRYRVLKKSNPEAAAALMARSTELTTRRFDLYKKMSELDYSKK